MVRAARIVFDGTPLAHQMISDVFLPMAKRLPSGRRRHGIIRHLRGKRKHLEKKMIRSGNLRAAMIRPVPGPR